MRQAQRKKQVTDAVEKKMRETPWILQLDFLPVLVMTLGCK